MNIPTRRKVTEIQFEGKCATCNGRKLIVTKYFDTKTKHDSVEIRCQECGVVIFDGLPQPHAIPYIV